MSNVPDNEVAVNPVKSRADYMRLAEESMLTEEYHQSAFSSYDVWSFSSYDVWSLARIAYAANAQVYATLALSAPETPSSPDPCAEELARQIGVMSDQNAKLYREKSTLLDLLELVWKHITIDNDEIEEQVQTTLSQAGRL